MVAEEAHGRSPVALGGGKFRAAGGVCGCRLVAAAAGDKIRAADVTGPARCGAGVEAAGGGIKSAAMGAYLSFPRSKMSTIKLDDAEPTPTASPARGTDGSGRRPSMPPRTRTMEYFVEAPCSEL